MDTEITQIRKHTVEKILAKRDAHFRIVDFDPAR